MQSAAKLRRESNAAYQISPKPTLDTNGYAKKEVGGRGGAYKYTHTEFPPTPPNPMPGPPQTGPVGWGRGGSPFWVYCHIG